MSHHSTKTALTGGSSHVATSRGSTEEQQLDVERIQAALLSQGLPQDREAYVACFSGTGAPEDAVTKSFECVFFDERKSSEELSRLEVELRQALERREEALDRAREELSQMEGFQDPAME